MSRPSVRRAGFTLVELLVVIAVIGILATITFGLFKAANESRNKSKSKGEMQAIAMAAQSYRKTYGDFPYCTASTGDNPRRNLLDQLHGRRLIRFTTPGEAPQLLPFNDSTLPGSNRQKRSFLSFDEVATNDDANINDPALCFQFVDAWGNPYDYRYRVISSHKAWLSPNFLLVSCSANFVPAAVDGDAPLAGEYWDPAGSGGSTMTLTGIVPATYFDETGDAAGPFRADNIVNWVN
ncbi:MAG: type II secretion system protein [Verrucomicrobia bacterium]|nr:type II secretion system protein [Verrucomicrobiota bacterium]